MATSQTEEDRRERILHLLMDCWECDLYEQLLGLAFPALVGASQTQQQQCLVHAEVLRAMHASKVGLCLWSTAFRSHGRVLVEDGAASPTTPASPAQATNSSDSNDSNSANNNDNSSSSGNYDNSNGNANGNSNNNNNSSSSSSSNPSVAAAAPVFARQLRSPVVRPAWARVAQQMAEGRVAPHALLSPYAYGEAGGPVAEESQPFRLIVHPQTGLVCDAHAHLSEAEVIGFLAGHWDAETHTLFVQAAIPCAAVSRTEDKGRTDVEMDSLADYRARSIVQRLGLQVVGWYHSHPRFAPDPSLIDLHNQQAYQRMVGADRDAPFVGLIVSSFDEKRREARALHQWFHVKNVSSGSGGGAVHPLPVRLCAEYESLRCTDTEREAEAALQARLLGDAFSALRSDCAPSVVPEYSEIAQQIDAEPASLSQLLRMNESALRGETPPETETTTYTHTPAETETDIDALPVIKKTTQPCAEKGTEKLSQGETASQRRKAAQQDESTGVRRSGRTPKQREFYDDTQFTVAKKQQAKAPEDDRGKDKGARQKDRKRAGKTAEDCKEDNKLSLDYSSLPTIKRIKAAEVNTSSDAFLYSLLCTVQRSDLASSMLAKEMLIHAPVHLRYSALLLVSLGVYYSRSTRRVDLSRPWKESANKLDKLRKSVVRFFRLFVSADGASPDPAAQRLLNDTLRFFELVWSEYSMKTGTLKKNPPAQKG